MSGMLLAAWDAKFDRVRIAEVIVDSPAGQAGVMKDDELLAVDGKPVGGVRLDDLRTIFLTAGVPHTITIARNGKTMEMAFTTRRLV